MKFKAVLALTKKARSAQTQKSISFIWIVWSTLYVYLCFYPQSSLFTNIVSVTRILKPVWKVSFWDQYYQINSSTFKHLQTTHDVQNLLRRILYDHDWEIDRGMNIYLWGFHKQHQDFIWRFRNEGKISLTPKFYQMTLDK